jgi:hypothetical protein
VDIIAVSGCIKSHCLRGQWGHRTKNGSRSKGRTIQTIGRAHAIKGFVGDRLLAIAPIANPALAMKKISDTHAPQDYRGDDPATGIGPLWTRRLHEHAKGDEQGDKDPNG